MTQEMKDMLRRAFFEGFSCSGEGFNAEYPFGDKHQDPEKDSNLLEDFERFIVRESKEQPT